MTGRCVDAVIMEGFKCFDALRLELGQMTMVTGFNGGGKSTALQPLLLIAQTLRLGNSTTLPLNGPLVRLGTAGDIAPRASGRSMLLRAEGERCDVEFRPRLQSGDRSPSLIGGEKNRGHCGLETLSFLGAVRTGVQDAFPVPEFADVPDVGSDGRFAPYWYDRLVDEDVDGPRRMPGIEAMTFRKQLDGWLGGLFPGAQANVRNIADVSRMSLRFRLSETGDWQRPANIGYGLTYAFPILVSVLSAHKGQVIVIDSPESHLHPSAQSQMGRILARFAKSGVQIIVESHSDHLLNGVRLAVRDGVLAPDDLRIHFFRGAEGHEHGVTTPTVGKGGEIYEWPDGFFDQSEKDLSLLAGWG